METISDQVRMLTEGSAWSDENKRIIIVFRIIWANAVNVRSFELLIIPDLKIVERSAAYVEGLVKTGKLLLIRECGREIPTTKP